MTLLNKILQYCSVLSKFNKTLWTGTFSSGNITVNDTSKYSAFRVTLQGHDCIGFIDDSGYIILHNVVNLSSNNNQYIDSATITVSGNVWTMVNKGEMTHNAGGNHSVAVAISITKIVGLIPVMGWGLKQALRKNIRRWYYGYLA